MLPELRRFPQLTPPAPPTKQCVLALHPFPPGDNPSPAVRGRGQPPRVRGGDVVRHVPVLLRGVQDPQVGLQPLHRGEQLHGARDRHLPDGALALLVRGGVFFFFFFLRM